MATPDVYRRQVNLLVRTLPFLSEAPALALKGGTAINLFLRDLPRLSVDLDLTYLPVESRGVSLAGIDTSLREIGRRLRSELPAAQVLERELRGEGVVHKLFVRSGGVQIKLEVTPVLRGCVFEPGRLPVSSIVEDTFGFAEASVVSFEDLFAGKLVAALDRQHPRDLFDVRELFAHEGLTERLRRAFVVYLVSHNRPVAELLAPRPRAIEAEFRSGFVGMPRVAVSLEDLLAVRDRLVEEAIESMPEEHRRFLVSFERGDPDWDALALSGVEALPAVRWKLANLRKLAPDRRARQAEALNAIWER